MAARRSGQVMWSSAEGVSQGEGTWFGRCRGGGAAPQQKERCVGKRGGGSSWVSRFAFGTLGRAHSGSQPVGGVPGTGCRCLWAKESGASCPWDRE